MEYLLTNELPVESVEYNFDFCDLETQLDWSIRQITNDYNKTLLNLIFKNINNYIFLLP